EAEIDDGDFLIAELRSAFPCDHPSDRTPRSLGTPGEGGRNHVGIGLYENWAIVARPYPIRGPAMKENALIQRTGFAQNAARAPFFRGILHQDVDGFATHDIADDLGINPRDRREAPRPISAIM